MGFSFLAAAVVMFVAMFLAVAVGVVLFIVLTTRKSNTPSNDNDD
jgi:hypothetical protein